MTVTNEYDETSDGTGSTYTPTGDEAIDKSEVDVESEYEDYLRYPILYELATEPEETNGYGALSSCISCQVVRTANQFPTLQMEYERDGPLAHQIQPDRIIMTDMGPDMLHQKFRIKEVQRDQDQLVVNANHIIADIAKLVIGKDISQANMTPSEAVNAILDSLPGNEWIPDIEFDTDISTGANTSWNADDGLTVGDALLGEDAAGETPAQSVQAIYNGEWIFDNYHMYLYKHAGKFKHHAIKYGRNLNTITQDKNIQDTYTAIYPVAKYSPNQTEGQDPNNIDWSTAGDPYTGRAVSRYVGYGMINLYDTPCKGHQVVTTLERGKYINIVRVYHGGSDPNTVNGADWYALDDGTWIDSMWVTFDKTGSYVVNDQQGHGHLKLDKPSEDTKGVNYTSRGVATVYYGNGANLWDSPLKGKHLIMYKGEKVHLKAGTKFRYYKTEIDEQGRTWLYVSWGRHKGWIYGPHIKLSGKNGDYASAPANGTLYIKKNAQQYIRPGKPAKKRRKWVATRTRRTHKYLKKRKYVRGKHGHRGHYISHLVLNPRWNGKRLKKVKTTVRPGWTKTHEVVVASDGTYYKLPNGRWVKSSGVDFHMARTIKPQTPEEYNKENATKNGNIEVYKGPDPSEPMNVSIPISSVNQEGGLDIVATASGRDLKGSDEITWYQIPLHDGPNSYGWIPSTYFDFTDLKDVEPFDTHEHDPNYSDNVSDEQVTVTLPEGILISDVGLKQEVPSVQRVDLSEYFWHDQKANPVTIPSNGTPPQPTDADIDQLRQLAQAYMTENRIGYPNVSLTLDYAMLEDLDFAAEDLNLYDRVTVEFDAQDVLETAEVNSTTWDCLAHRYVSITLGSLPITWSHYLLKQAQEHAITLQKKSDTRFHQQGLLIQQAQQAVRLQGNEQKAAIIHIGKTLGIVTDADLNNPKKYGQNAYQLLADSVITVGQNAIQAKDFIESSGGGIIRAYPNWQDPTEFRIMNSDGSYTRWNGNGYEIVGSDGLLKLGMNAQGQIIGDEVDATQINTVKLKAAEMDGTLKLKLPNSDYELTIGAPNDYASEDYEDVETMAIGSSNYSVTMHSGRITIRNKGAGKHAEYGTDYVRLYGSHTITISANNGEMIINGNRVLTTADVPAKFRK